MIQITCKVNSAICTRTERLTSGMVGLQCEFVFDSAWDGLAKTAVFLAGNEQRDVLLQGVACTVPWEVLQHPGYQLVIGVYGSNADGTLIIPTVYAMCGSIAPGADPSGEESTDPTLPVWGQLQGMIGNLDDLKTTSKDTLVAAINEAAQSGGGGSGVQPDWNQNDVSAPDYVKNRTHWEAVEKVEVVAETTVTIETIEGGFGYTSLSGNTPQLTVGQTYFVTLNGVSYECVAWKSEDAVIIGNGDICGVYGGNDEPFCCDSYPHDGIYLNVATVGTYTISISTMGNVIHKLDKKYLPDEVIDSINNAQNTANNAQNTANNAQNTANNAVTKAGDAYSLANTANTKASTNSNDIKKKADLWNIDTNIDITDAFSLNVGETYKKEQAGFMITQGTVTKGLNAVTFRRTRSSRTSYFDTLMTAASLYDLQGLLVCHDVRGEEETKIFIVFINNISTTSTLIVHRVM